MRTLIQITAAFALATAPDSAKAEDDLFQLLQMLQQAMVQMQNQQPMPQPMPYIPPAPMPDTFWAHGRDYSPAQVNALGQWMKTYQPWRSDADIQHQKQFWDEARAHSESMRKDWTSSMFGGLGNR